MNMKNRGIAVLNAVQIKAGHSLHVLRRCSGKSMISTPGEILDHLAVNPHISDTVNLTLTKDNEHIDLLTSINWILKDNIPG